MCHKSWAVINEDTGVVSSQGHDSLREAGKAAEELCLSTHSRMAVYELCEVFEMPEPKPVRHIAKTKPEVQHD